MVSLSSSSAPRLASSSYNCQQYSYCYYLSFIVIIILLSYYDTTNSKYFYFHYSQAFTYQQQNNYFPSSLQQQLSFSTQQQHQHQQWFVQTTKRCTRRRKISSYTTQQPIYTKQQQHKSRTLLLQASVTTTSDVANDPSSSSSSSSKQHRIYTTKTISSTGNTASTGTTSITTGRSGYNGNKYNIDRNTNTNKSSTRNGNSGSSATHSIQNGSTSTSIPTKRKNYNKRNNIDPDCIERRLNNAYEAMKVSLSSTSISNLNISTNTGITQVVLFPTVRECNAAIAHFGDTYDLLRALRMFGKMRKVSLYYNNYIILLQQQQQSQSQSQSTSNQNTNHNNYNYNNYRKKDWNVLVPPQIPTPTIVTYSTLMSRAVKLNKPLVALRLWNLMIVSSSSSSVSGGSEILTVDVKATNILMNCYAKLANVQDAKQLLYEMKYQNQQNQNLHQNNQYHKTTSPFSTILLPEPNLVTYNTFLNVCLQAKDLDSAMDAFNDMVNSTTTNADVDVDGSLQTNTNIKLYPDIHTFTTLIACVARKLSKISGKNDPTLAFTLYNDMIYKYNIQPNGMTYSALIDVCSRCSRSDLALYGLRLMLQQKQQQKSLLQQNNNTTTNNTSAQQQYNQQNQLTNEVGAWTAAINACGKAGRLDTAVKLFHSMSSSKFGTILPNTVTCGCLTDSLLRVGRIDDAVDILRYMKQHNIVPSEVMYTSLMTRAEKLVQMENKYYYYNNYNVNNNNNNNNKDRTTVFSNTVSKYRINDDDFTNTSPEGGGSSGKAIEVYTELIRSLRQSTTTSSTSSPLSTSKSTTTTIKNNENEQLILKTFLVFQQMKDAGAQPDLACYNALLSACAKANDLSRARYVLRTMQSNNIIPNDTTWRLLMRSALHTTSSTISTDMASAPPASSSSSSTIALNKSSSSITGTDDATIERKEVSHVEDVKKREPVETIWRYALSYHSESSGSSSTTSKLWKPSIESFYILLSSYLRLVDTSKSGGSNKEYAARRESSNNAFFESWQDSDSSSSSSISSLWLLTIKQHMKIVQLYFDVLMGRNSKMGMDRIDIDQMLQSSKVMILVLQSILVLIKITSSSSSGSSSSGSGSSSNNDNDQTSIGKSTSSTTTPSGFSCNELQAMATSIALLECFQVEVDRESILLDTTTSTSSSNNNFRTSSSSSSSSKHHISIGGGSYTTSNTNRSPHQYQQQQHQYQYQSSLEKALSFGQK